MTDKTDSFAQLPEEFRLYSEGGGKWHDQPFCTSSDKRERAADGVRPCLTCHF